MNKVLIAAFMTAGFLVLLGAGPIQVFAAAEESVGVQAGHAVKKMNATASQTYATASEELQEATAKVSQIAAESSVSLKAQADSAMQKLQEAWEELIRTLTVEYTKFVETLNTEDETNATTP